MNEGSRRGDRQGASAIDDRQGAGARSGAVGAVEDCCRSAPMRIAEASGAAAAPIVVSAVVIMHPAAAEILMVRKAGTTSFMLPGGKPEPGETALAAVIREAAEELAVRLDPQDLSELGTWTTPAANESGRSVTGTVFLHRGTPAGLQVDSPIVAEEIAEAGWFPMADLPADTAERQFAPLTREAVLPYLHVTGLLADQVPVRNPAPEPLQ